MIIGKDLYESYEDEKMFSTGDSELDDILEEVYYSGIEDGYDYAYEERLYREVDSERTKRLKTVEGGRTDRAGVRAGVKEAGLKNKADLARIKASDRADRRSNWTKRDEDYYKAVGKSDDNYTSRAANRLGAGISHHQLRNANKANRRSKQNESWEDYYDAYGKSGERRNERLKTRLGAGLKSQELRNENRSDRRAKALDLYKEDYKYWGGAGERRNERLGKRLDTSIKSQELRNANRENFRESRNEAWRDQNEFIENMSDKRTDRLGKRLEAAGARGERYNERVNKYYDTNLADRKDWRSARMKRLELVNADRANKREARLAAQRDKQEFKARMKGR